MFEIPLDGGPVYAETNLAAFIAEPWNALSSLAIVLPGIYWAIRLKWQFKQFTFIYSCIPLLVLGGIGSTLYHAFRTSQWLLLMDVLPAALLTLCIGIYFWIKVLPSTWLVFTIVVPVFVLRYTLFEFMKEEDAVNLGYFLSGSMIFIPILILGAKKSFKDFSDIFISIAFLSLSLLMRELDNSLSTFLPMGSHFLWHLLSGMGAFFLARFLYRFRIREIATQS